MTYLFYGTKDFQIKKEIDSLKEKFDPLNIIYYDLNNDSMEQIIEDCNMISLFENKKLIICENAKMFSSSATSPELLEKYLKDPNPATTIIFVLNNEKIDERKKITKFIKANGVIKEFNNDINNYDFIKNEFKDYNIERSTINLLLERVGNNFLILKQEIDKIKLYKGDDKNINDDDIINLTHKNVDTNIFKLIDSIISNNKSLALEIYHEMLNINEEPLKILILLANQFRLMYQAKSLKQKGLTEKDIATTLKAHPYSVKLAIRNGQKYSSTTLLKYINELADMDINIKTGNINKNLALELFILKK